MIRTRYPIHLHFDASGTAIIRPFGKETIEIRAHFQDCIPRNFAACPESIGLLGRKCSICKRGDQGIHRRISLGWDVVEEKWCHLMSSNWVVSKILDVAIKEVGSMELFCSGYGPDILIQRVGNDVQIRSIEDTCIVQRGDNKIPDLREFLRGLESRSKWAV
jgi:hypothetical protein